MPQGALLVACPKRAYCNASKHMAYTWRSIGVWIYAWMYLFMLRWMYAERFVGVGRSIGTAIACP
jgi:hypothetical protein